MVQRRALMSFPCRRPAVDVSVILADALIDRHRENNLFLLNFIQFYAEKFQDRARVFEQEIRFFLPVLFAGLIREKAI